MTALLISLALASTPDLESRVQDRLDEREVEKISLELESLGKAPLPEPQPEEEEIPDAEAILE